MQSALTLVFVTGFYPLLRACRACRGTTLTHALLWALAAWLAWCWACYLFFADNRPNEPIAEYLALSLTGCAGVAVLGARRPGVAAWNFVVLGLLAVLLLPFAEGFGRLRLTPPYLGFLAAVLLLSFLNYLPTRLALPTVALALGCAWHWYRLGDAATPASQLDWIAWGLLAASPWLALGLARRGREESVDGVWLWFRDAFGVVWGQRVREQFNRAAANAGWPVNLSWQGLVVVPAPTKPAEPEMLAVLRAVLKRFGLREGA
jgi:hypothetical protein